MEELHQRITGRTELLALLADPIRHSHSPRMHNLALTRLGLDYAYLCFEVDAARLPEAVRALRTLRVCGANVSMPNKTAVLEHVDEVSPAARLIGAANTLVLDDGRLRAENTDGLGAVRALAAHGVDAAGAHLVVLGAGGAARAIAVQAALDGAERIDLLNRRDAFWDDTEAIARTICEHTPTRVSVTELSTDALRDRLPGAAALVDATSVGMEPAGRTNVPDVGVVPPGVFVMDVVYSPPVTRLLRECAEAGIRCTNGLDMMFFQGAASFRMWTGREMPLDYVRAHLDLAAPTPETDS